MDDNREQRQHYGHNRNRHRGRHDGGRHHGQGRGRAQRPLLTSATNAAGLALVAMVLMNKDANPRMAELLGLTVILFGTSAFVSYIAQRLKPAWIEKISDLLFIVGLAIFVWMGAVTAGFLS